MEDQLMLFDVVVVGAGPGGSAAARRCAQGGLKTLLLEGENLPREKVCSGMIMGPTAQALVSQEFGEVPQEVLAPPRRYSGVMLHVPGIRPRRLEQRILVGWRKDLDHWMNSKAAAAGTEIRDGERVKSVQEHDGTYLVTLQDRELNARFVIGADGALSVVRKSLFPDLDMRPATAVREFYRGELELEKEYFHWFLPFHGPRPRFDVCYRGEFFALEGGSVGTQNAEIKQILTQYGFDPAWKPAWKDGCALPRLHGPLISGAFSPAKGNALLVGDAAGLPIPLSYEGIGTAIKSGILAADSVIKALATGQEAANGYLQGLEGILRMIRHLQPLEGQIEKEATKGDDALLDAYSEGLGETLRAAY
jgi:menaquinone-9 beta-reductase